MYNNYKVEMSNGFTDDLTVLNMAPRIRAIVLEM